MILVQTVRGRWMPIPHVRRLSPEGRMAARFGWLKHPRVVVGGNHSQIEYWCRQYKWDYRKVIKITSAKDLERLRGLKFDLSEIEYVGTTSNDFEQIQDFLKSRSR